MEENNLIEAEKFCITYNVQYSFLTELEELELIETTTIKDTRFIPSTQLPKLEQILRLHFDLDINLEGIEAITHLLDRVSVMQDEITILRNRLRFYEEG